MKATFTIDLTFNPGLSLLVRAALRSVTTATLREMLITEVVARLPPGVAIDEVKAIIDGREILIKP